MKRRGGVESRRALGYERAMPVCTSPLVVRFADADLDDLRRRLANARLAEAIDGAAWSYGIDVAYLRELLAYWKDRFDWRAVERELAAYEHVRARVDGLGVHVLRARSPVRDALPLLLVHGWPGSVLEFRKVLGPLSDPASYGGNPRDAFDVIAPSIPGYGLSDAPPHPGYDIEAVAQTFVALMSGLGFERYGAQGGDWGAMATSYVALLDPGHCVGLHLNMALAPPPKDATTALTDQEIADVVEAREYMKTGTAYQSVQTLEPDLIGVALTDSPAALAAWIVSKFRAWSDCGGDVERRFTKDELLANVTWYWLTKTGASSTRLYAESRRSGRFGPVEARVEVPTACAIFPREIFRPPRAWVERLFNVRRWTAMKAGGHFAAMEEPAALVADVREFFRDLR